MQTAAIPYRVADFLKQHPPFQFMDQHDLVALAARGRVKFHEVDEYICWQSSSHTPFIYVIQQGSVSLWDESCDPPALCDIRGAGDCISIERFNGSAVSLYSAKAASDVVLYALRAVDLEPLLKRNQQAAAYVAAHSAIISHYAAAGERPVPHSISLGELLRDSVSLQCPASTSIQEAARLLNEANAQALALTDSDNVVAILTTDDLLRWISGGANDPGQSAQSIAQSATVTVGPKTLVSDCVLAMAESQANAAAITIDGSRGSAFRSTVTASNLTPAFGDHPITILRKIAAAPNLATLRALNGRARAWIIDHLTVPPALDWLASWGDLVNRRILERVIQLTDPDSADRLYCFYGAAGRRELLTPVAPSIAVIGTAPASLEAALAECGYISPDPPMCGSLDEWKARFSGWIRDPINTQVYLSRPLFDLRPVLGCENLFPELEAHVRAELEAVPLFLHLLANDCLCILPPLTFFRDLVIEESGERTDTFRLETSVLQPLVDVARVFSLASGSPLGASTADRFQQACRLLPSQELIFRDAAETMRIVLFHQARAGIRMHSSGAEIPLAILSRHDRQVLKSGFRSLLNLLEFTAPCDWLESL